MSRYIGIHGFYGMKNLGDEALLQVFLQELPRVLPHYSPIVYSYRPDQIRKDYEVSSTYIRGSKKRWIFQQWSLLRNRLFVLGGGGLLHDYGPDSSGVRSWLSLLRRSQKLGRKTSLFFIGVDEIRYEESRKLIAEVIPKVDFITVRDKRSADFFSEIGLRKKIHEVIDPAILLVDPKCRCKFKNSTPRVAVCLRHWFKSSMETENSSLFHKILDELALSLDQLIKQYGAEIIFFPMRDIEKDDDRIINQQVFERLKYKKLARCVSFTPSVPEFINALDEIDILIGMRLHSLILASAKGIPVIAIEYMPKVREYMRNINQEAHLLKMELPFAENLNNSVGCIVENYQKISSNLVSIVGEKQLMVRKILKQMFSLAK